MKRRRITLRLAHFWLALACGLVPATPAPGQGTIVYHQPAEPLFGLVGLAVDLNGDGQADDQFYNASYFPCKCKCQSSLLTQRQDLLSL